MKKPVLMMTVVIGVVVALCAVIFTGNTGNANAYTVEMSVSRMTCGSCVENIRAAVVALEGTESVATDVVTARSTVVFNPDEIDANRIAETISAAGYPATILLVSDAGGSRIAGIDTDQYVARIGTRMVQRDNLSRLLQARVQAAETAGKPVSLQAVYSDAWLTLLSQELLLNASEQFGVTVSRDLLDERAKKANLVAESDLKKLHNELLIEAYLEQQYAGQQPNAIDMNNLLNKLYNTTNVDIFDSNLKRYLSTGKSSGGCGGSCCG